MADAITISEGARRYGIRQQDASTLMNAYEGELIPSHSNGLLLDEAAQRYLANAAANINRRKRERQALAAG